MGSEVRAHSPFSASQRKAGVPGGRAGQAQDVANGVLFLASDTSSYMTGAELVIDRGNDGRCETLLKLSQTCRDAKSIRGSISMYVKSLINLSRSPISVKK